MNFKESEDSSWAWGFNDLILVGFTILLILLVLIAQDYRPESLDIVDQDQIVEFHDSIRTLKLKTDSLAIEVEEALAYGNNWRNRYFAISSKIDLEGVEVIDDPKKPDTTVLTIPFPLFASFSWNQNSNARVRLYIHNRTIDQYIVSSPAIRSVSMDGWGLIWRDGSDYVNEPDLCFVQEELVPGEYDIYLRTVRGSGTMVSGFIHLNKKERPNQLIELDSFQIGSTPLPWRVGGEGSFVGKITVSENSITWTKN